jgi:hypothetical protein
VKTVPEPQVRLLFCIGRDWENDRFYIKFDIDFESALCYNEQENLSFKGVPI